MQEFQTVRPVEKGWSGDKKYHVTTKAGEEYLLRVCPVEKKERLRRNHRIMAQLEALGVPLCTSYEVGECPEGVYTLQKWVNGEDAERALPLLSDTEQYLYGLEAGRILQKIHSIPAPQDQEPWEERYGRKIERKLTMYAQCELKYENDAPILGYIAENRHLIAGRPQCWQHGDYHIGNMMLDREGKLQIIDFDRDDYGDPWEEFNRIVWCAQACPFFATGMVDGYFDGQVPEQFWRLLCLYIGVNTLSSLPWAIPFGQEEVDTMRRQCKEMLEWYGDMTRVVPAWYTPPGCLTEVDGVPFRLKAEFDFGFLRKWGRVFKVFDDQDSGNICFGLEDRYGFRRFVKFAGAPTVRYGDEPALAVQRLRKSVAAYRDLRHPSLISLEDAVEIGGGFALVFAWAEGISMGRMYPGDRQKFEALPLEAKKKIFWDVAEFFRSAAVRDYLSVDFYDASVLYDPASGKTTICDIDFYRRMDRLDWEVYTVNDMGRMWGSSRFQAPEEYELGARLDEVTNVYTLGAFAFALFSGYDRTGENWPLSPAALQAAQKAVRARREERYPSIAAFMEAWRAAVE